MNSIESMKIAVKELIDAGHLAEDLVDNGAEHVLLWLDLEQTPENLELANTAIKSVLGVTHPIEVGNKVRCYDFFGNKEYYVEGTVILIEGELMQVEVENDTLHPTGHRTRIQTPVLGAGMMDDYDSFTRIELI